jgi:hypothetical protein
MPQMLSAQDRRFSATGPSGQMSVPGSKAPFSQRADHFRSTPINRHSQRPSARLKGADRRHHSITSSPPGEHTWLRWSFGQPVGRNSVSVLRRKVIKLVEYAIDVAVRLIPYVRYVPMNGSRPFHSITSSAVVSSAGGMVRPSVLAVFRLMTNSNFVGCTTGRSAGFSPLRIRPA